MFSKLNPSKNSSRKKRLSILSSLLVISLLIPNLISFKVSAAMEVPTLYTPFAGQVFTSGRNFLFDWSSCSDSVGFAIDYEIQVSTEPNFSTVEFYESTELSSEYYYFTSYQIDDGFYYWRVRAEGFFEGWSAWSYTWNFTIAEIPPLPPILISPFQDANLNTKKPEFNWEISLKDTSHPYHGQYPGSYNIQISNSSDFSYLHIDSETLTNNYTSEIALSDGEYWWRVRPIGFLGTVGQWSTSNFTVDTIVPTAPIQQSPNIAQLLTGEPTALTWDYVAGAKEYNVQLSNNEYFLPTFFDEKVSSYYYITATSLSEGTYYWRVRAIDFADNVGVWSDIWYFKVDTNPPTINEVTFGPTLPTVDDEVMIYCDVTDFGNINYIKVTYQYDGEEEWFEDYATLFMGTIYTFSIGPFSEPRQVNFYLTAVDEMAHVSNSTMFHVQIVQPITSANYPLGVSSVLFSLFSSMIISTVIRKKRRKKS